MSAQNPEIKKYNTVISKLFQIVLELNEEQQFKLLRQAESLLVEEKRINIRKSCDIPINYASDNRVYTNLIKNISRSGVFVETREPLIVGDEIIMTFRLDGLDRPFKTRGEIARATRDGVGIRFIRLSPYLAEMMDVLLRRMNSI
jgi:hypothetical protein